MEDSHMKKNILLAALLVFAAVPVYADDHLSASPEGARVYIISPQDGETVATEFAVKFGLSGMGVAPAGTDKAATGHHHLLVNGKQMPVMDKALGKEVMHFGGGQTETTLTLPPGQHTLQLILGDKGHVPHNPPVVSDVITVTVK
jgi:hypothetical protein